MTEAEWWATTALQPLLEFVADMTSGRKLLLFACACCRLIPEFMLAEPDRSNLELAERDADGQLPNDATYQADETWDIRWYRRNPRDAVARAVETYDSTVSWSGIDFARKEPGRHSEVRSEHQPKLPGLLRHIIGNPFKPYPAPAAWPSAVVELAQALYDGAGDRHVLADAIEEAGHGELAEHFRGEESHPKGCWAMDLVLGKV